MSPFKLKQLSEATASFSKSKKMPVLFIGHGHPMNALYDNRFTQSLKRMSQKIEKPNAIMVVSAHWETKGTYVSVNANPQAIYDFGRFDDRLFQIQYAPAGHPELARTAIQMAEPYQLKEHATMGLDHGAWTILKYLYPEQDVPVFQMSMDVQQGPTYHFELAKALRKLREKGVLIIGSGNIVHNLRRLDWQNIDATPHDWAIEFDALVRQKLEQEAFADLIEYQKLGKAALLSVPTNDHYLPMLYTLGLMDKGERITQLYEGYQYAGISMRCFQIGET